MIIAGLPGWFSPANAGDTRDSGSIPGLERYLGRRSGNPLQYSSWKIPWTEGPGRLQYTGPERERNRERTHTALSMGFPGGSDSKESACNPGDPESILRLGRSHGEGNGYSFQYYCLENSMDRGAWQATIPGVTKSQTQMNN